MSDGKWQKILNEGGNWKEETKDNEKVFNEGRKGKDEMREVSEEGRKWKRKA